MYELMSEGVSITIMSDICLYAHIYVVMPQGTVSL